MSSPLSGMASGVPSLSDRSPISANGVRNRPEMAGAKTNLQVAWTSGRRTQAGVGLIEVLVAVLVLSIGFLGIAAMEAMSLSTNNSAMARSMATISSYSILDAMRADKSQAIAYNGTVTANACPTTTTSLAATQLGQWCKQLGDTLGSTANTTGKIECATSGVCTVTITFDDSRAGVGGASDQTVITKATL